MQPEISSEEYEAIERRIESAESPVGIDAKHTHVLILHLLGRIEQLLSPIEQRLERVERALERDR